jgi:DNA-directed RNA polymerase specialized sigma24 family protein
MLTREQIRKLTADELDDAVRDALDMLSDRQRVFCEKVVEGRSQTEAAKLAGYEPTCLSGCLRNPAQVPKRFWNSG